MNGVTFTNAALIRHFIVFEFAVFLSSHFTGLSTAPGLEPSAHWP